MSTKQRNIEANIKGNVSGQAAIGKTILQVGDIVVSSSRQTSEVFDLGRHASISALMRCSLIST